jgi:hypothetical protein
MNSSNQKITSLEARCPVLTQSDTRNEGIFKVRAARYRGAQARSNPWQFVLVPSVSGTRTRTRRNRREYEYKYEYHFIDYEYEGGGRYDESMKASYWSSRSMTDNHRVVAALVETSADSFRAESSPVLSPESGFFGAGLDRDQPRPRPG